MTKLLLLIFFAFSSSFAIAQQDDPYGIISAVDLINGIQVAALKSGAIADGHVVIIDGIIIADQSTLSAALSGIRSNSIMDYSVLDKARAVKHFGTLNASNGAIVIVLQSKALKRFSRNIRKIEKRSAI